MCVVGAINCLVAKLQGKFFACDIIDNLHCGQFKCDVPTIVLGVWYKRKFPQTFECD